MHETSPNRDVEPIHSATNGRSTPQPPIPQPKSSKSDCLEWLTVESRAQLEDLLRSEGIIQADEQVTSVSRAGDGNMNLTLRVRTSLRSVIVKQSRPWVEKYPQIAAPVERSIQELRFYQAVGADPALAARMPRLLGAVPARYLLVIEDLGESADASSLYRDENAAAKFAELLPGLVQWLELLHGVSMGQDGSNRFANRALRRLNHQHLFVVPFLATPAVDLDAITPGLAELAQSISQQPRLQGRLKQLGDCYLSDGNQLVHGDFFPGSWLFCEGDLRIIDPEFSHCGRSEFDLGVLLAHGHLLGASIDTDLLTGLYSRSAQTIQWSLVEDFAAVEILRRLLGVAQLPLTLDLQSKAEHLDSAMQQLTA